MRYHLHATSNHQVVSHQLPALRMSNKKPKDWWWGHFDTHPDFEKKLPAAYANEKERRPKVMCGACKITKTIDEQQKDREEQHQGLRNDVRTHDQIIAYCKCLNTTLSGSVGHLFQCGHDWIASSRTEVVHGCTEDLIPWSLISILVIINHQKSVHRHTLCVSKSGGSEHHDLFIMRLLV